MMLFLYLAVLVTPEQEERFEKIYEEYKGKVANISFAILKNEDYALDSTHDVFFKIAKNIEKLPIDKEHERAYIYELARNSAIDRCRKKRITIIPFDEERYISSTENYPDYLLVRKEKIKLIMSAINKMDEKSKRALILRYVDDMKFSDIASLMNIPENTVKSYVKRGIAMLRRSLSENEILR